VSVGWEISAAVVAAMSFVLTRILIPVLQNRSLIDIPNERSSHVEPTPRGGGWAIVIPVLGVMIYNTATGVWTPVGWAVIFGVMLLALVSWVDDVRTLGVKIRLLAQLISVALVLLSSPIIEFDSLSTFLNYALLMFVVLAWIWFINLYNFMDGIDGITGVQTITVCIGIAAVYRVTGGADIDEVALPLTLAAATAGFLCWNWSPARIFLGDVGSVFLGYIVGWLLLQLALSGQWAAAIILPMYYLADATITLCRRIIRREKFWKAHKEHFYQRAHQAGLSHANVSLRILVGNIALVGIALYSVQGSSWGAIMISVCVTGGVLFALSPRQRAS